MKILMNTLKRSGGSFGQLDTNYDANGFSLNSFSGTPEKLEFERDVDADAESELISAAVFVIADDEAYTCTSDSIDTINSDAITWVQFTGLGNVIAGKGISKTGNQLDIEMVRVDQAVSFNSGTTLHTVSHPSISDSAEWNSLQTHPMTMVYLNGVLLEPSDTQVNVGANSGGDYYIIYSNSATQIDLDTNLAIDGDKLTIIHASVS